MNAKISNPNYQPSWKQDEITKYHEQMQQLKQEREQLKKTGAKRNA